MSEFKLVDGKIIEMVETEVVEDEIEANLQAELDQAQNAVNAYISNLTAVEEQYQDAEAKAEAAGTALDKARADKEAAEATLTKSIDRKNSWGAALQLRQEQLGEEPSDGDGETVEDSVAEPTETVEIPITIAEG